MRFEKATLATLAWTCLIVAAAFTTAPAGAGGEGMQPALEAPAAALDEAPAAPGAAEEAEPAVETPEVAQEVPALAGGTSPVQSLLPNPCYQFDDPITGCYYKWRPSDYCCISPDPRCISICY